MPSRITALLLTLTVITGFARADTSPPGPPGSEAARMKTLDQVEPRQHIETLPYTITNSGSYYLTCNLDGVPGSNGIVIAAEDVQLDLSGFVLHGGSNSLDGILVEPAPWGGGERFNISIRNGVIVDWGGSGINATNASQSEFAHLKVFENGGAGIAAGNSCLLLECASGNNTNDGICAAFEATVRECKAVDNGGAGILVEAGSRLFGCTAVNNSSHGIAASDGVTISDCKTVENIGHGIKADLGCRITGATAADNRQSGINADEYCFIQDCLAAFNHENGIEVTFSCLVADNNCGENGLTNSSGAGITVVGSANRIQNNNLPRNWIGLLVQGEANWIAGNTVIDNQQYGIVVTNELNVVVQNGVGSGIGGYSNFLLNTNNQTAATVENLGNGFTGIDPWANFKLIPDP